MTTKKQVQIWQATSAVLIVALIGLALFMNNAEACEDIDSSDVTKISGDALEFMNEYVLSRQGVAAKLISANEESGIIKLNLEIENELYPMYVTKDGKTLFPQAVSLDEKPGEQAQPQAQPQAPASASDASELMDDDSVKGSMDAPVTIIEWSDFECPYCARFYSDTYLQLVTEYIDTGKVRLVFRDFPLGFHKNAQKAAEAAECAGEQSKYYDMHDLLFAKGVVGGVSTFKQYAKDLSLDTAAFDTCLDSGKMEAEVKKDMADGAAAGIKGTPGFIINGKTLSGAQPFSAFKAVIDAELAK